MPRLTDYIAQARKYYLFSLKAEKESNYREAYEYRIKACKIVYRLYKITGDTIFKVQAEKWMKEALLLREKIGLKVSAKDFEKPERVLEREERRVPRRKEEKEGKVEEVIFIKKPRVTFKDVGGLENVKELLNDAFLPLKNLELAKKYGLRKVLEGILLYGPPGCGKTLIIEAAAGEHNIPLVAAHPAALLSKWFGESEKNIRKLFEFAKEHAPVIILIDEVDALTATTLQDDAMMRVRSTLLQELEGVQKETSLEKIVITAMTSNKPWLIDPAIIRTGRIKKRIYVPPPDYDARKAIFEIHLSSVEEDLKRGLDYDKLAELTSPRDGYYYSGSDIKTITETAKLRAFKRALQEGRRSPITMQDFKKSIEEIPRSITPYMLKKYEKYTKMIQESSE